MDRRAPSLLLVFSLVLCLSALAVADSQPLGWHSRNIHRPDPPEVHMTITDLCTGTSTCSVQVRTTYNSSAPDWFVTVKVVKRPQAPHAVVLLLWNTQTATGRVQRQRFLGTVADGTTVVAHTALPTLQLLHPLPGWDIHVPITVSFLSEELEPITVEDTLILHAPDITGISVPGRLVLKAQPPVGQGQFTATVQLVGGPEDFQQHPLGRRSANATHAVVGPMQDFTVAPLP